MKKLLLLTKTLLAAALLCVGQNAWGKDLPYTIGETTQNWETDGSYSDSYTLATGKTLTFTFSVDESGATSESEDWKGYVAVLQESSSRHTLNTNTYSFVRSMCDYNVKNGTWNEGAVLNTNTYPSGAKYSHFVGADVTMTLKRIGTYLIMTTAITKSETTYYHYYQQNLGTTDDLYAFLCADWAKLTLKSATTTDNGLTVETYDFTTASPASSTGCSSAGDITVDGSDLKILENAYFDMKGRFAGAPKSGGASYWNIMKNNGGLQDGSANASKTFAVLNLTAGDYVTINYTSNGAAFTLYGEHNITGLAAETSIVSGQTFEIKTTGSLLIKCARSGSNYPYIKSIIIATSTPVLERPTFKFNSMVESEGLYYPKYTFSSVDDGVKFYDESDNDITSGYTFTSAGTLKVYAKKAGRTSSAKTSYTVDATRVGMILANSIEDGDLVGTVNYETGAVLADNTGIGGAKWVIPGLDFSGSSITYRTWGIMPTSGPRNVICNVLNENRVATYEHYDYVTKTTGYDYLTSSSNSATLKRKDKDNYDRFSAYALYVNPSEVVSVTIGTTGYSTFSSPVPLNFAGIDGLTAYVATSVADGTVNLTSVTTAPANTGLVLKGTAEKTYNIPVTNAAVAPASNLLVGCIVETPVAVDATSKFNNYVLAIEGGVAKFQSLVDMGATIPAGKAFLKNGAVSLTARALRISFDDITGINQIDNGQLTIDNSLPVKRIVNGKLIIEKKGVKYNAAGAQVK